MGHPPRFHRIFPENEAFQRRTATFISGSADARKRMAAAYAVYEIGERKMDAILDTLAASRKLEESGMPEPQAGAVVEDVDDD